MPPMPACWGAIWAAGFKNRNNKNEMLFYVRRYLQQLGFSMNMISFQVSYYKQVIITRAVIKKKEVIRKLKTWKYCVRWTNHGLIKIKEEVNVVSWLEMYLVRKYHTLIIFSYHIFIPWLLFLSYVTYIYIYISFRALSLRIQLCLSQKIMLIYC